MMRKLLWLLLCVSTLVLSGATVRLVPTSINNRQYYQASLVGRQLGLQYKATSSKVELRNASGSTRLIFYPNKRFASVNGVQVTLDYAPAWRNGTAYISTSDYRYLISPLYFSNTLKGKIPGTIVIDPGHGGTDKGASGKSSHEKNLTLIYAKKLQKKLKQFGYTAVLTRTGDSSLSLQRRGDISRGKDARLFVSIHMNATKSTSISGIETYALTPPGAPSSSDRQPRSTYYRGNAMAADSTALAFSVQKNLIASLKATDRGVKRARFVVLTNNSCPAILVECGFISNRAEESRLNSASYQDKFTAALAEGIRQYCRRLKK